MISLILTYLILSKQFKLKHADKGSYICETKSGSKRPLSTCTDLGSATEWRIERKPDGQGLIYPTSDSNVWDIAEASRVEVKVMHGKINQRFSLVYVSPDKYAIVSIDKCLTLEDPYHFMRACDYGSNQLYTIMYNESEASQLTETKSSIGSSGSPVDQNVVDKLQQMIDDNKEIARHISYAHDRHSHEHGHGHGHGHSHGHSRHGHRGRHMSHPDDIHHTHEELHTHSRKKEDGPYLLNFMNQ